MEAPGRKIHHPQEDVSTSVTSSDEPLDARSEGSADATSETPLCVPSLGRDLQSGYVGFVRRLEKVYRALGTLRRPDDADDADFEREPSPERRGQSETRSIDGHVEGLNNLRAYKDWDTALDGTPPSCPITAGIQTESLVPRVGRTSWPTSVSSKYNDLDARTMPVVGL